MKFDYSKLRGRIREICNTQENYANLMGLSETSVTNKLNNITCFTQFEMVKSVDILKIPIEEIGDYFFALKIE